MTVDRRTVLLVVGGGLFLIGSLAFLVVRLDRVTQEFNAADAALVISGTVAQLHQKGRAPKPEEVEDAIRALIRANVIVGKIGPDQKPLDPFGTPYQVSTSREGSTWKVTVTSAGPDRAFGTADDITRDTAWEQP